MLGQPSVVDLPLTEAHRAAIRRAVVWKRRLNLGIFTFFVTLIPSLSVWLGRHVDALYLAAGAAGLAIVADRRFWHGPARRDLQRGTYRRASGPVEVVVGRSECQVRIGGTTLRLYDSDVGSQLRALPWGSVDYVPDSRVVFEQRTGDGELVCRSHHFRPDEPAASAVNERLLPVLACVAAITATLTLGLTSAVFAYGNVSAGDEFRSVAFSPDGTLLASASRDGTVRLLRAADGSLHAALRLSK